MLILLKLVCFGLWLAMMLKLILAGGAESQTEYPVILRLDDIVRAEYEIKRTLHRLTPEARLYIEISCLNAGWPELLLIASRLQQANPSIIIRAATSVPIVTQLYQPRQFRE